MQKLQQQPKYKFYPSLLDKFGEYLNSSAQIDKPWNANKTPDEVVEDIERELLNMINRVPFESEATDRGTAFNELVDLSIENRKQFNRLLSEPGDVVYTLTKKDGRTATFTFPRSIVEEFAEYFRGSIPQVFCRGTLTTKYGVVELYGYSDEVKLDMVYDIKTTSQYSFPKYPAGWQKHVYPFCLTQRGCHISGFEYTITDFRNSYQEYYPFNYWKSEEALRLHSERLIEYLEAKRDLITDKKIFAEE